MLVVLTDPFLGEYLSSKLYVKIFLNIFWQLGFLINSTVSLHQFLFNQAAPQAGNIIVIVPQDVVNFFFGICAVRLEGR